MRTEPLTFMIKISYSRFSGKKPTAKDIEKALDDYFNKGQDAIEKFLDNKSEFYIGGYIVEDLGEVPYSKKVFIEELYEKIKSYPNIKNVDKNHPYNLILNMLKFVIEE